MEYEARGAVRHDIDRERAIADYSEAIRLDPNLTSAYQIRALAYRRIGRKDLAEADKRTAKSLIGK
jgi:Tfp pilus assembly protein PilF